MCRSVMYLVALLGSCLTLMVTPSVNSAEKSGTELDVVSRWLRRSQEYAAKMKEEPHRAKPGWRVVSDTSLFRIALCEAYAGLDRVPEAIAFVRNMNDATPEDRSYYAYVVAVSLAQRGKIETAIRCAGIVRRERDSKSDALKWN